MIQSLIYLIASDEPDVIGCQGERGREREEEEPVNII